MSDLLKAIALAKDEKRDLFYNSSGSKQAYQLGVKHISSAEFLGFADSLPNGDMRIKKEFLLINFEEKKVLQICKGTKLRPIQLASS